LSGLDDLQQKIGVQFKDVSILKQALVHRSFINENPTAHTQDNERMEFLGDSLLNFIVAEKLYTYFPNLPEGKLTEIRISLIRQEKLAEKAALLNLGGYMQMGKGEEMTGGRTRLNNLADAFEALLAAIYLDSDMDCTRHFVLDNFKHEISAVKAGRLAVNYKALLQELTQSEYKCLPEYEVVEATGPDHDKMFCVSVSIGDVMLAVGSGKSKKIAESEAARLAYGKLSAKDR
jgi:ribonuclease III